MARKCLRCAQGQVHVFRHGTTNAYSYHDCRCGECVAFMRAMVIQRRDYHPEERTPRSHHTHEQRRAYYQRERERFRAADIRQRSKFSRAAPEARRRVWTAAEDAIAIRDDLTILEMAYLLGRNRGSIMYRRGVLRQEQAA